MFGESYFKQNYCAAFHTRFAVFFSSPVLFRKFTQQWAYATGRQKEEDGKSLVRDERDKAITCVFCRDLD